MPFKIGDPVGIVNIENTSDRLKVTWNQRQSNMMAQRGIIITIMTNGFYKVWHRKGGYYIWHESSLSLDHIAINE